MRILMVSDVYFPRINGVSTAIQTLRRELTTLGHHVTLIAPDYGTVTDDEAGILRLPARTVWRDPEDRLMPLRAVLELLPQLREQGFDLVHIHTPFVAHYAGLKLARALGVPVIETYHTFFEEYLFHYVPFAPKALMRWLARHFSRGQCRALDALIAPSRPMLEALRAYGIDTPARVVPTGLDLDNFRGGDREAFLSRHGIDATRPLLLYVGRVAHEKNIGFLLDVLRHARQEHPGVLLVIAGEGPARETLREQASHLGLAQHVHFVGYLDRSRELLDCYRAADLFVFSSRTETQGLVLLEAMACGLPVVGLAVMGTAEVLRHGAGAHIADDDPRVFAATVSALLHDHAARAELAHRALDYVKDWTAQEMTRRLVGLYEQTLSAQTGWPVSATSYAIAPDSARPDAAYDPGTADPPANAALHPATGD